VSLPVSGRRIWVLAKGYAPDEGGMQTYARGVAEAYAALGADVTVFTQTSAGPRNEQVGAARIVDIGIGRSAAVPIRLLGQMRRERRRTGAPDFVHATTWRTALLPLLGRLPYTVTVHGREMSRMRGAGAAVMDLALRRADRIVAVSRYTLDRLLDRLPEVRERAIVAWNGKNDAAPATRLRGGTPLVFTLCRLEPRKNVAAAIRAAAACAERGHDFTYLIAGRGPDRPAIEAQLATTSVGDRIRLLGFVPDEEAARLYGSADIFFHPQIALEGGRDFEGFGIAIADAMAAGAACIVGTEGGSAELVEDGAGLAVDGCDDRAIAGALEQLLADPEACRAMGERGAERARLFDWEAHCRLVLGL
jgi:phosphatidyl-myo-inositol dimannoside synthase